MINSLILPFRHNWNSMIPRGESSSKTVWLAVAAVILSPLLVITLGIKLLGIACIVLILYLGFKDNLLLFCFFLIIAPFIMYYFWDYFGRSNVVFAAIISFFWIARVLFYGRTFEPASKYLILLPLTLIFFIILSALNSDNSHAGIKYIILFPLFFTLIYTFYEIYRPGFTLAIMASATIPIFVGAIQQLYLFSNCRGILDLLNLYRLKPSVLFNNVNTFGGAIIAIIPFWLSVAIWSQKKWLKRVSIFISFIMILTLLLTNARASIFGFFVSIVAICIWAKKLRYLVVALIILGILFTAVPPVSKVVSFALRMEQGTTNRDMLWKSSLDIISKNLIFGVGYGNYQSAMYPYLSTGWLRSNSKMLAHAHNFILNITTTLGIVGLLLALWLYYFSISQGIGALKKMANIEDKAIGYGIFGCVLALMGWSIFETGWMTGFGWAYPDILFWIPLVMLHKINKSSNVHEGYFRIGSNSANLA